MHACFHGNVSIVTLALLNANTLVALFQGKCDPVQACDGTRNGVSPFRLSCRAKKSRIVQFMLNSRPLRYPGGVTLIRLTSRSNATVGQYIDDDDTR